MGNPYKPINLYKAKKLKTIRIKDNQQFYQSKEWQAVRKEYIKNNPFCAECLKSGVVVMGTHIDHIIPWQIGGDKFDFENLQTLCHSCHSIKTYKEMKADGRL